MRFRVAVLALSLLLATTACFAFDWPKPNEGDYIVKDFQFASGEKLPELRLHYLTWGEPKRDAQGHVTNAVLILHSTGGSSGQFLREYFAGALFNPGQILDVTKYYIIMPDSIGHGKSSKPSDGMHAKFPAYRYADMVKTQQMLVADHLKVDHLRLVMGMSMGCMHAWMWAETYPTMMDGTMPLACLPVEIAGRNRMWRQAAHDAITKDPEYNNGDYAHPVHGLGTAEQILQLVGSNPHERQLKYPTGAAAIKFMDETATNAMAHIDGNDLAYALDSSLDYNPEPKLAAIPGPVLAINSADDLINPPDIGIFEPSVKKVPKGRAILIPETDKTHGHGTHTYAEFWKQYLQEFLQNPIAATQGYRSFVMPIERPNGAVPDEETAIRIAAAFLGTKDVPLAAQLGNDDVWHVGRAECKPSKNNYCVSGAIRIAIAKSDGRILNAETNP